MSIGATSLVATAGIGHWMSTLDYAVAYRDPAIDPGASSLPRFKDLRLLA